LKTVFYTVIRVEDLYKRDDVKSSAGREPPLRQDFSAEAED
jgi:hypothetical protein